MKWGMTIIAILFVSMASCSGEKETRNRSRVSEFKMLEVAGRQIDIAGSGMLPKGIYIDGSNSKKLGNYRIASETITIEKWQRFIESTKNTNWAWPEGFNIEEEMADIKRSPAFNMTWFEAVEYCNWLSDQEGFAPVYEIIASKSDGGGSRYTVIWHKAKNGYRLPTPEEWQNAVFGDQNEAKILSKKIAEEFNAAIASDGYKDLSGRDRNKIFAVNDIYKNSIGLYVNLSQNVCEYSWGFAKIGDSEIIRVWPEDSIDEQSMTDSEVIEMLPGSLQTCLPDTRVYNATIRVARNGK